MDFFFFYTLYNVCVCVIGLLFFILGFTEDFFSIIGIISSVFYLFYFFLSICSFDWRGFNYFLTLHLECFLLFIFLKIFKLRTGSHFKRPLPSCQTLLTSLENVWHKDLPPVHIFIFFSLQRSNVGKLYSQYYIFFIRHIFGCLGANYKYAV